MSGKTTLTAALVALGCQYLSDEVAALEPGTQQVMPFARSLYLRRGGLAALTPLFPGFVAGDLRRQFDGQSRCYLPPPDNTGPKAPVPMRLMVFPRHVPGAQVQSADGLEAVVKVLRGAERYSLTIGNLRKAVEMLLRAAS